MLAQNATTYGAINFLQQTRYNLDNISSQVLA